MGVPTLDKVLGYNLYIGGFIALRRPKALANCNITHIVSALDWKFEDKSPLITGYEHLYIPVDDVVDENLIEWFAKSNDFIISGLNQGQNADGVGVHVTRHEPGDPGSEGAERKSGVLVHCAMGKSRSSTLVIAYLLRSSLSQSKQSFAMSPQTTEGSDYIPIPLNPDSALSLLRTSHPIAEPNDGFMDQLRLYHSMGCPDEDLESRPKYQRWLYERRVKESLSVNQAPEVRDVRFEDEHFNEIAKEAKAESQEKVSKQIEIKCRKCRRLIARGPDYLIDHEPASGKDAKDCAHVFLHPLSWMREPLSSGALDGRLTCPNSRCGANLGKFAWQGLNCSCGGWVTPGFGVAKARVDEAPVKAAQGGMARVAGKGDAKENSGQDGGVLRMPPGMTRRADGGHL